MDKFKPEGREAAESFDELAKDIPCERRKMFGYSVGFIRGNMFAGVFADRLFFRIKAAEQAKMKESIPALRDFEPVAGRRMKDYLEIGAQEAGFETLRGLIAIAAKAASELPEKKPKRK